MLLEGCSSLWWGWARCWCRGKGSWGNLGKIGTWTLRILSYQPAGRHLESSYLNPFEVRVSCRGIGQRVWRAEKTLLLLPMPPTSLSLRGATSAPHSPGKGPGQPAGREPAVLAPGELEHPTSCCPGLGKGTAGAHSGTLAESAAGTERAKVISSTRKHF